MIVRIIIDIVNYLPALREARLKEFGGDEKLKRQPAVFRVWRARHVRVFSRPGSFMYFARLAAFTATPFFCSFRQPEPQRAILKQPNSLKK